MSDMRAWVLRTTDGPEAYRLEEVEAPEPAPGEVRVRLCAAALNHLDLWVSRGQPRPPLPHVAGADGAGVIDALGDGAAMGGLGVGDEVVINPTLTCGRCGACTTGDPMLCPNVRIVGEHRWGTLADMVTLPAGNVVRKPAALGWPEAAAIGVITATALRMLRRGRVSPGDRVLVSGAGGGVGAAAVAVAVALGAEVYATSTKQATLDRAVALGAVRGFDSRSDVAAEIRAATGGLGVDCAIEHAGPATWAGSIGSLARGGRLVTCGGTSGQDVTVSLPVVFWRQLEIIGSTMASPKEFAEAVALVDAGRVPALVDEVFTFEDLPQALRSLDHGGRFGKVVVQHSN